MQLSDRTTGVFLIALGALATYGGWRLPPMPGQPVGPSVFPMVVGIGLSLCGAMIALGVGRHFEEEAEADLAAHSDQSAAGQRPGRRRGVAAVLPPALLVFYVVAVDRLGFLATAAAIVLTMALALGARLRLALPLCVGAPVAVYLVFSKLLRVPLPQGLLPFPW